MLIASFLLIVFLSIFFCRPVETEDIWWHLKAGQFIVQHHFVPSFDPFPLETQSLWTLTQWLGSLFYYSVFAKLGLSGLILSRVLIFLLIFAIFFRYAYKKIPIPFLLFLIFLMAFPFGLRSFLRPFVFNPIFIQLLLIMLLRYQNTGEKKGLFLIPLMGVIWSNLHLGSFVFGAVIFLIFLGAFLIQHLGSKLEHKKIETGGGEALKKFRTVFILSFLFFLSFFINPYGPDGLLYPAKVFLQPHFINFYRFNSIITENYSPIYILHWQGLWFWILSLLTLGFLIKSPQPYLTSVLLFVASLSMFLYSQRGADFFALTCGYIIVDCASRMDLKKIWSSFRRSRMIESWLYFVLSIILIANILHTSNKRYFNQNEWHQRIEMSEDLLNPQSAVRLAQQLGLKGEVFNSDIYGGYLLWHAYPGLKPFVDGRQLNQNQWNDYLQALKNPEIFWPILEAEYHFKIILFDAHYPVNQKFLQYIAHDSRWQLIHVDGYTVLYVKRETFKLPPDIDKREQNWRELTIDVEGIKDHLNKLTPNDQENNVLAMFLNPKPYFIDSVEEGLTLYDLGFKQAGLFTVYQSLKVIDLDSTRFLLSIMISKL